MYLKDSWKLLAKAAREIIIDEELPRIDELKFRSPLNGVMGHSGVCKKRKTLTKGYHQYTIILTTTMPKFVKTEKGKHTHISKDRKTYYRRVKGDWRPWKDLVNTMAHELAHLKFWDHTPSHKSYTNHLHKLLDIKIKEMDKDGIIASST